MTSLVNLIGNTPLVDIKRIYLGQSVVQAKLEFYNPGGSLKDRAALGMITQAIKKGLLKKGDTLVESTSGNLGISIAMISAALGLKAKIVVPESISREMSSSIAAYGAEVIPVKGSNTEARDFAAAMAESEKIFTLNQFDNDDNWKIHYQTTGPEIWDGTCGKITHFITTMGSMGTITGVSKYLKEKNPNIAVIGVQPDEQSQRIPGIIRWPSGYEPDVGREANIDHIVDISLIDSKRMALRLSRVEGISCGYTTGAALCATIHTLADAKDAHAVFIACDRADKYISTLYRDA